MSIRILLIISILCTPMFGFGKSKKEVAVEFIEQGKTEAFASSVLPVDQLPETFEINTVLDIADDKWSVVSADPEKKSAFSKSGKLKVYLAKIQSMDPADILYSLPTISNELAELREAQSLENVLIIQEDDWRQIEFLSDALSGAAKEELLAIRSIYENERKGVGFKSLHVRKGVPLPLKGRSVTLESVEKVFGVSHSYEGLAFNSTNAVIDGGFAFEAAIGIQVWGQSNDDGILECLCFSSVEENVNGESFKEAVGGFAAEHGLLFIDWVTTFSAASPEADFQDYLN